MTTRPHRRLALGLLQSRIEKLSKWISKVRKQLEDAERHIAEYDREAKFRIDVGSF